MIVCIEVNEHFNFLSAKLKTEIDHLQNPISLDHYNRIQTPVYHSQRINILKSGSIRLELTSSEPLHSPPNNHALIIFEAGDYIPILEDQSAFKLVNDGAIDIEQYELNIKHFELINTSQAIFIELFAAQVPQQENFTPEVTFFKPQEMILNKDETGNTLHTLVEGHACAEINGTIVGEIRSGESFGVVATLTNGKRSADVRAISNCMVMTVAAENLENMIKHNPHLSLNIMKSLANNLLQANEKAIINAKE